MSVLREHELPVTRGHGEHDNCTIGSATGGLRHIDSLANGVNAGGYPVVGMPKLQAFPETKDGEDSRGEEEKRKQKKMQKEEKKAARGSSLWARLKRWLTRA